MSGGHFDYKQFAVQSIAEEIQGVIDNNYVKRVNKQDWESEHYYEYPKEVIKEFKKAVKQLQKARVYAQRIDWLLSGDDGIETFFKRLKEELDTVK